MRRGSHETTLAEAPAMYGNKAGLHMWTVELLGWTLYPLPDLQGARQNQGEAERKEVMELITKLKWERTGDSDWCLVFAKGIFTGMSVAGINYDKSCEYYICFCQGVRIGACTNLDEAKADIENRVKELAEENWPTEK